MRIRHVRLVLAMVLMLLTPSTARADGHRAGLFGGISFAEGSVLTGANISVDFTGLMPSNRYVGAIVDYGAYKGTGFTRQVFMGGIGVSRHIQNFIVGAHGLIGRVWGDGDANLVGTFGADFEYVAAKFTMGTTNVEVAPLARTDYGIRKGPAPSFWRVSTGLQFRWK